MCLPKRAWPVNSLLISDDCLHRPPNKPRSPPEALLCFAVSSVLGLWSGPSLLVLLEAPTCHVGAGELVLGTELVGLRLKHSLDLVPGLTLLGVVSVSSLMVPQSLVGRLPLGPLHVILPAPGTALCSLPVPVSGLRPQGLSAPVTLSSPSSPTPCSWLDVYVPACVWSSLLCPFLGLVGGSPLTPRLCHVHGHSSPLPSSPRS